MNTEEKAKAYDEALNRAKKELQTCGSTDCDAARQIFRFFPQLRESEDERITRAINNMLPFIPDEAYTNNRVTKEGVLNWLEKQKEKTENATKTLTKILKDSAEGFRRILKKKGIDYEVSAEFWENEAVVYSKEEDVKFHKWMDDLMGPIPVEETYEYKKGLEVGMKQKEQKHPNGCFTCDEYKKGYEEGRRNGFTAGYNKAMKEVEQKEQKPVEYLSKDKVYAVMNKLTELSTSVLIPLNSDEYKKINEITSDIRSLLDYPIEQKPVKRSMEDDHIIGFVYDLLNEIEWKDSWAMSKDECLRLLSNYIPQKSTEWSEDYREEDIQTRFAFYTYKDDSSVLYLSNVFVEETSRNHGFGTRILKAAEKVAETIGATTISLKVKQDSPANAWYRKNGYGYVAFEDGYDWLEKNLEYMKPNKQEWSEEDIDKMVYERARKSGTTKTEMHFYRQGIEDTLKSLRPSWKPSEEQMKALYCAIEDVAKFSKRGGRQVELENESYYSALHSLYCNLEKLM